MVNALSLFEPPDNNFYIQLQNKQDHKQDEEKKNTIQK